jgi:Protein of unknown function (DUF3987)
MTQDMRATIAARLRAGTKAWTLATELGMAEYGALVLDVEAELLAERPPAGTAAEVAEQQAYEAELAVETSAGTGQAPPDLSAPSALSAQPEDQPTLSAPRSLTAQSEEPWPTLDRAAMYGISGEVVSTLAPHTEADEVALLLSFLAAVGNIIGGGPHALADAADHPGRLAVVLVGQTSRARKGSAQAQIRRLLAVVEPAWTAGCILRGLASGEALISEVRDGGEQDNVIDKRRLVIEPEFARLLAVAGREGSTLSAVLREAWDGDPLKVRTKHDALVATGAHVSAIGHITREELLRRLDSTEAANGFANRFLFALVRRSKLLPEGGNLDPALLDYLADQVGKAIEAARQVRLLYRSPEARELWATAYEEFGDGEDGLAGAVTARGEAQALRLSVIYAALDGSEVIEVAHLEAALAVWRYCEQSALLIFGDSTGDPIADKLLAKIREVYPAGLDGTEQRDLFQRHVSATRLELARKTLAARGLIVTETEQTGGRPRVISRDARKAT